MLFPSDLKLFLLSLFPSPPFNSEQLGFVTGVDFSLTLTLKTC